MRLLNRKEALLLDQLATQEYQIPIEQLIETVAQNLLLELEKIFSIQGGKIYLGKKVFQGFVFLIGPGNNGKDGLYLKEKLQNKYPQTVCKQFQIGDLKSFSIKDLQKSWIVIDALFGVGLDRELPTEVIRVINEFNENKTRFYAIAVDVPTGLNADTGSSFGTVMKADLTFSCELPKVGFFFNQGPLVTGEIKTVPVGFPKELLARVAQNYRLIQKNEAQKLNPSKQFHGNKTKYGHLLIIAGSEKMPGALRLSSEAAARAGVGYVTLALDEKLFFNAKFIKQVFPDFILVSKEELLRSPAEELRKSYSAILLGPGLEKSETNFQVLQKLISAQIKMLIDAQGLNMLAEKKWQLHKQCVVTPHSGELSRLIGLSAKEIDQDKMRACQKFSEIYQGLILAKGAKSVLHNFGKNYVINSGNKALAKAGTGDVLAGIISSYMAQGLSVEKAVCLGTFIHGALADLWIKKGNSVGSLLASDLVQSLRSFNLKSY